MGHRDQGQSELLLVQSRRAQAGQRLLFSIWRSLDPALRPLCPPPPPTLRKHAENHETTVRWVPCLDKPMLARNAQYQKNACRKHPPIPHPNHDCHNSAPEHNVRANFSMFWTSSLPIRGRLILNNCTFLPFGAGCRFWNGFRLLIPWDKTFINNSCKVGISRRTDHKHDPAPFSLYNRSTTASHCISDYKNRRQKKAGKRWSDGVPCLDKLVLAQGGAVKQRILSYHMTPATQGIGHRSSLSNPVLNFALSSPTWAIECLCRGGGVL